jgi:hypothetical protein
MVKPAQLDKSSVDGVAGRSGVTVVRRKLDRCGEMALGVVGVVLRGEEGDGARDMAGLSEIMSCESWGCWGGTTAANTSTHTS